MSHLLGVNRTPSSPFASLVVPETPCQACRAATIRGPAYKHLSRHVLSRSSTYHRHKSCDLIDFETSDLRQVKRKQTTASGRRIKAGVRPDVLPHAQNKSAHLSKTDCDAGVGCSCSQTTTTAASETRRNLESLFNCLFGSTSMISSHHYFFDGSIVFF